MDTEIFRLNAEIEDRHWWFHGRREIVRRLLTAISQPDQQNLVVDVGCGTGGTLGAMAQHYRCLGIDPTAEAIDLARERFPGIEFIHGLAPQDLPPTALRGDAFLLMDVLEHVEDDAGLLERLISAVRPGAHFVITVPADPSLWSPHDVSHGHFRRYQPESLSALWEDLPVSVSLLSYFNARLFPVVKVVRGIGRRLGTAAGKAGTDLTMPPGPLNHLLFRLFSGEAKTLVDTLSTQSHGGYPFGVSMIAVLTREAEA